MHPFLTLYIFSCNAVVKTAILIVSTQSVVPNQPLLFYKVDLLPPNNICSGDFALNEAVTVDYLAHQL